MADFFFFTDAELLQEQEAALSFGVVDKNNYKIDSMHTASGTPKAYAVTSGKVLVQEVKDNPNLVNVVLKPLNQPDLNLPVIEYIIYKGILKSSLIVGEKVAPATMNNFTAQVHGDIVLFYENFLKVPVPDNQPKANETLGLNYKSDATDENYIATDDTALNKAFYNSEINGSPLQNVKAGMHIGDVSSTKFGILVSFEKVGYIPTFKLARELDSAITLVDINESSTNAEKFKRKHNKGSDF